MAVGLPRSEFVGIDLAPVPVRTARSMIAELGIENIRCEIMDLLDSGPELGKFDYIIAHGFYSWVPPAVREKLLALCGDSLTSNGIAFISYNTYPGGHIRQASREMMRFHNAHNKGVDDPVRHGIEFLQFLLDSMSAESLCKTILRSEVQRLTTRHPNSVYHDDLGTVCTPFYFADFVRSANQFGLQFLSEAMLGDMIDPPVEANVLQRLEQFAGEDVIALQQYLDFILNRGFRRTLLCRLNVSLDRTHLPEALTRLSVASSLRRTGKRSSAGYEFSSFHGGGTYVTKNDIMLATLAHLEEIWPRAAPFPELLDHTIRNVDPSLRHSAEKNLAPNLLRVAAHSLVDLRTHTPALVQQVSARPVASPLVRFQCRAGSRVTTIFHHELDISDERVRWLIQMLDGSRDHAAVADALLRRYPDLDGKDVRAHLNSMLLALHRTGILVG
jgi:methyltransferase-like protein